VAINETPSQTVGPYFAYGLTPEQYGYAFASVAGPTVANDETTGQRIRIEGRVLDGNGEPIADAMIEIWQADGQGRYAHPADQRASNTGFRGFGRCGTGTDPANRYWFETIRPGAVDSEQAPHISVAVFMRGLLIHAYTRIYFPEDAAAHARDPVLAAVPAERRGTLIAERTAPGLYSFDIHMQGDRETVFFDL